MSEGTPWAISFERRAEKDLDRLDKQVARRVIAALDRLLARDPSVEVRRLQGSDEWRLRVGDSRVRLRLDFDDNTVIVVRILPTNADFGRFQRLENGRSKAADGVWVQDICPT